MKFEWDPEKAQRNSAKHAIDFDEAATVFGDALATTSPDPRFLEDEQRFVTSATLHADDSWWSPMSIAARKCASSAPEKRRGAKGKPMNRAKKPVADDDILPEYDFSAGVRGKYYQRYQEGTNIVVLAPDVAEAFPTSDAVNEALRLLVKLARDNTKPVRPASITKAP